MDCNRYWDPGFLELHSGSQSLRFRIPHAKVSRILDAITKNSPDSGIQSPSGTWKFITCLSCGHYTIATQD